MNDRTNLAYDMSRYEAAEAARAEMADKSKKISSERTAKPSVTPLALVCVVIMLLIGATLAVFLTSKADIAAVHADIVAAKAEVEELKQENSRMKTELEKKSSQKAVEEYAENVLGMQKLNKSQIEYVSLESGNVVEVSEKNDSLAAKIQHAADAFMEYIGR